MSELDAIGQRMRVANHFPGHVTIEESQRDVEGMHAALAMVWDWAETLEFIEEQDPSRPGHLNVSAGGMAHILKAAITSNLERAK